VLQPHRQTDSNCPPESGLLIAPWHTASSCQHLGRPPFHHCNGAAHCNRRGAPAAERKFHGHTRMASHCLGVCEWGWLAQVVALGALASWPPERWGLLLPSIALVAARVQQTVRTVHAVRALRTART